MISTSTRNTHKKENQNTVPTPYDDAFRTLMNDCIQLLIPVINEIFGKHYTGKEKIITHPNEHFINQQDGNEQKRITDSSFSIISGNHEDKYIFLSVNLPLTIPCSLEFLSISLR